MIPLLSTRSGATSASTELRPRAATWPTRRRCTAGVASSACCASVALLPCREQGSPVRGVWRIGQRSTIRVPPPSPAPSPGVRAEPAEGPTDNGRPRSGRSEVFACIWRGCLELRVVRSVRLPAGPDRHRQRREAREREDDLAQHGHSPLRVSGLVRLPPSARRQQQRGKGGARVQQVSPVHLSHPCTSSFRYGGSIGGHAVSAYRATVESPAPPLPRPG